jgi:hypothetical protein
VLELWGIQRLVMPGVQVHSFSTLLKLLIGRMARGFKKGC